MNHQHNNQHQLNIKSTNNTINNSYGLGSITAAVTSSGDNNNNYNNIHGKQITAMANDIQTMSSTSSSSPTIPSIATGSSVNVQSNSMILSSSSPGNNGQQSSSMLQMQLYQQQQQQQQHQQRQNSPPVLLSSQHSQQQQQQHLHNQHQQLQRSISSTTSSSISPVSPISQMKFKHQQQQQHNIQHQNQYNQQQQQHHHHHHHQQQHLNHHPDMKTGDLQSTTILPSIGNKSSCWCFGSTGGDTTYHFKTLVPAVAAGAIIGKGGETIAALQRDAGARVKMSKSHDFYPGTSERVCLITGSIDAIMTVVDFIMDKIREKPDLTTKLTDAEAKQAQERDKQVKILVPNSTAGMIIGKAGAYIKQIKEESGSYVQISQKPKDITLEERCITIIGEKDNNKTACKMIISKIVEDPQSGKCTNVSYADINGPVANYNPTGSPYASNQNAISSSTASLNTALGGGQVNGAAAAAAAAAGILVNGTGINLSLNLGAPNPSPNTAIASQLLEHIKPHYGSSVAMRNSGYADSITNEVCAALAVLAKYGVLGMGVGLPHTNGAHHTAAQVSYLGALEQSAAVASAAAAANSLFGGALGQVNLEQYISQQQSAAPRSALAEHAANAAAAAAFDPFRHAGQQAATPISINNNSFGLAAAAQSGGNPNGQAQSLSAQTLGGLSKSPTPGDLGAKETKNVEIPEVIVGAILGPNGRSLVEIQHVSGASVQISKKGIFAPGTRNRVVTITGQPNAIQVAQYLIEQKITEEESKRSRQTTTLTNVVAN